MRTIFTKYVIYLYSFGLIVPRKERTYKNCTRTMLAINIKTSGLIDDEY